MRSSAARVRSWLPGSGSRLVVLASPHPVDECLQRLAAVTSHRGSAWYADPQTAGLPNPRLRGEAGPSRISVARFEDAIGRDTFVPWLEGRLAPATGGTTVSGRIGLSRGVKVMAPLTTAAGCLIALTGLAVGITILISGHLGESVPVVLIPLALIMLMIGINVTGRRSLEQKVPRLVQEVNSILDSTVIFLDRADVQASAGLRA